MKFRFPIVIIDEDFRSENTSGFGVRALADAIEREGLRDLCQRLHDKYKKNNFAKLTTQMYLSDMEHAMKPADAFSKISKKKTERIPIDELEGRITTSLLTPYPPGIPLLIPGERFNNIIVKYLNFAKDFNEDFPGFEAEIHGLISNRNDAGKLQCFVDCVKKQS